MEINESRYEARSVKGRKTFQEAKVRESFGSISVRDELKRMRGTKREHEVAGTSS